VALYHFARTADDLADEGEATADERLDALKRYRDQLALAAHTPPSAQAEWAWVFGPLHTVLLRHDVPLDLLHALLDAFVQDVDMTARQAGYAEEAQLLDYCSRSANPVGRLLLHLYGVRNPHALTQSDAICTALQLINFWQDCGIDLTRGRCYCPADWMHQHGTDAAALRSTLQKLRDKLPRAVIVLGAVEGDKVQLVAGVGAELIAKVKAGELVNFLAAQVGGKGGGKPDMAMAGGTDPSQLDAAIASARAWVAAKL
jgi:phytoene/squalene synthetase